MSAESDMLSARTALLRAGEEISGSGTWAWDLTTGRLLWSENMFRILGVDADHDAPSLDETLSRVHPADRERLKAALEQARLGHGPRCIRYRVVTRPGTVRFVEAVMAGKAHRTGGPSSSAGFETSPRPVTPNGRSPCT